MIHCQVILFNKRIVKMINTLFFVLCLVTSIIGLIGYGIHAHSMLNEDSELNRQLKLVNKSPIKSIYVLKKTHS